jgi:hypothetical protein
MANASLHFASSHSFSTAGIAVDALHGDTGRPLANIIFTTPSLPSLMLTTS